MSVIAMEPKILPLNKTRTQLLVLDVDPSNRQVRAAYWRAREFNEPRTHPAPAQPFDRMVELGAIRPGAKREAWVREAVARDTLEDVLYVLFKGDGRHEWRTLVEYVRATGWGSELP